VTFCRIADEGRDTLFLSWALNAKKKRDIKKKKKGEDALHLLLRWRTVKYIALYVRSSFWQRMAGDK
jgi:hypothetical protein